MAPLGNRAEMTDCFVIKHNKCKHGKRFRQFFSRSLFASVSTEIQYKILDIISSVVLDFASVNYSKQNCISGWMELLCLSPSAYLFLGFHSKWVQLWVQKSERCSEPPRIIVYSQSLPVLGKRLCCYGCCGSVRTPYHLMVSERVWPQPPATLLISQIPHDGLYRTRIRKQRVPVGPTASNNLYGGDPYDHCCCWCR